MSEKVSAMDSIQECNQRCVQGFEENWYRVVTKEDQLEHLFNWEAIPGRGNKQLIEFMQIKFDINIKNYDITKREENKTILISNGVKSISLNLYEEDNRVLLVIDDVGTDELIAKKEDDKLNIYGFIYSIMQGDIIPKCPHAIPPAGIHSDTENATVKIIRDDVIVMNQTCDIAQKKLKFILVCPISTLTRLGETNAHFKVENNKEALRRGYNMVSFCLMNAHLMVSIKITM
jgi:hypothetical protein